MLLFLVRALTKSATPIWRLMLGACVGALYILIFIFPQLQWISTLPGKLVASIFIVWVAFGYHSPTIFFRHFSLFYLIFFTLGGGMYAVHSMLQTQHEIWRGILISTSKGYGHPITWLFLLLTWPIVWFFTRGTLHSFQSTSLVVKHFIELDVTFGKYTISCIGLIDTGNQLRDPITRAPVVIIESRLLKGIVPDPFLQSIHEFKDDWNAVLNDLDDEWGRRFRMIPFRSISKDSQFMMALKPDKIVIRQEGKTSESNKVLIGIDSGQLSSDGTYRAIVHPGLIVNH